MVDLNGHPFIKKQYSDMLDHMKNGNITKVAICQRSIAAQVCKFYFIKYLPKYKSFNITDRNFPMPMEMVRLIDAMGFLDSKYTELLYDMVSEGNKGAHPEGKELPSERKLNNNCRDLDEFLSVFIKEFPNEMDYKEAGNKTNTASAAEHSKAAPKNSPKQASTRNDIRINTSVIVKRKSERKSSDKGYVSDQYFFQADSIPEISDTNVSILFEGKRFDISESFYSNCIHFLNYIFDKGKAKEVFSISRENKTVSIKDRDILKVYFGSDLKQEDMISFCFILMLRTIYPNRIYEKIMGLDEACPCGSGKRYKHCCIYRPRVIGKEGSI